LARLDGQSSNSFSGRARSGPRLYCGRHSFLTGLADDTRTLSYRHSAGGYACRIVFTSDVLRMRGDNPENSHNINIDRVHCLLGPLIGVTSKGRFHSVEPGKLTMASYFAEQCLECILAGTPA